MLLIVGAVTALLGLFGAGTWLLTRKLNEFMPLMYDGPPPTVRTAPEDKCWSCDSAPATTSLGLCGTCETGLIPAA